MTTRVICTEAQIRRAIRAAQKEGLPIAGMRPDGTIIFGEPPSLVTPDQNDEWTNPAKWNKPGTK
jgi:hypothetical protein